MRMKMKKKTIGEFIRKRRIEKGLTLRRFCLENNLDPAYISRIERDVFIPSKEGNLEKIAEALGIEKESEEWFAFFDLAYVSKGKFPKDLKDNPAFIKSLPLFFRTVRGKKPTKKDLKALVDALNKEGWK
jgi:transcriptional regulator with XRE-family HTH domain